MATPKKGSPEAKAWAEKMRKAREEKQNQEVKQAEGQAAETVEQQEEQLKQQDDVAVLLKRIEELEKRQFFSQPPPAAPPAAPPAPQVSTKGITGTLTKYSINPKDYPDPTERLFEEPKLKLQNFNRNWWDLEWSVSSVNYETKDGVHMREPKFRLKLIRIIEHPETGEPSDRRYVLHKVTFFEDPDAAIVIANQAGIEVPEFLEKDFLDEMRYLRIRDWVLESFYPRRPSQNKMNKTETVIGNRLVEVFEINSQESETIPFEKISKKL